MIALVLALGCGNRAPAPGPAPAVEPAPKEVDVGDPLPPDSVVQTMQAQLVLDHPSVAPFLHLEVAGNAPLKVFAVPELAKGAADLRAGGQPVQVVGEGEARLHLVGRESLEGPRVRLTFRIPDEGVEGHVDVELADYVWSAVDASVAEH
ncbi:MAG: hypothetical protein H6737_28870 [Alphaproteobacteria bacterium]|nr:hypothetical protein [Alphaproteobacteria bacterium]